MSGGADSVFLITILNELLKEDIVNGELELAIMHLNHNIRGKEAKRDEDFVRNLRKDAKYSNIYI